MVRSPPAIDSAPKVMAAAASASARGSSRSRTLKTSASVAAIRTSAAPRSTKIALRTASASPAATTGTPVTTYLAPPFGLNAFSAVAVRIRSIARCCSASVRSGRSRICARAAFFDGNRYAKRDFGTPGCPVLRSKTSADTKLGSLMLRHAADAVSERLLEDVRRRTSPARPARRLGEPLLLRRRVAAPLRQPPGRLGRLLALCLRLVRLLAELGVDLVDRGVDERARPVHHLRRVELGDARGTPAAGCRAPACCPARCRSDSPRAGSACPGPR